MGRCAPTEIFKSRRLWSPVYAVSINIHLLAVFNSWQFCCCV